MKCNNFPFDCVHLICYQCHKINQNPGRYYIASSAWKENKNSLKILSFNDFKQGSMTLSYNKNISTFLSGIMSDNDRGFWLNCLYSF